MTSTTRDSMYPITGRVSRRRVLRGSVVTLGGLAGAALVGCSSTPATPAAPSAPAGGSAATNNATYPAGSSVPVVQGAPKDGGTFTRSENGTSPEQDMYTANSQSIWKYQSEMAMHRTPGRARSRRT